MKNEEASQRAYHDIAVLEFKGFGFDAFGTETFTVYKGTV